MAEQVDKSKKKLSNSKKLPLGCLLTLLKYVFIAGAAFTAAGLLFLVTMDKIVMPVYQRTGKEIQAPDLRGMSLDEAGKLLKSISLNYVVEKEDFNGNYPSNTIYLQIPPAATKIKPGRNVRIHVSLGQKPVKLPDVVGLSKSQAAESILYAGLRVNEDVSWIPSNDYLYGIVAAQSPAGGSDVPDTTIVTLYISNGLRVTNTVMPNLLNLSYSAASDTLRVHGFNSALFKIQYEEQPDLLPDTVIDQNPDPGAPANRNDEVILIISATDVNE